MDIVERLRGPTKVTQYDSAGRLETYEASPSQLDLDAANEIERLRRELAEFRVLHPVTQIDEDAVNARLDVVAVAADEAISRGLLK